MVDAAKFSTWLTHRGAEIVPVTNEHEAVRFKGKEVGVLYKSGKVSNTYTAEALSCFIRNKKWDGRPVNIGRQKTYVKEKVTLLGRDGDNCFCCGLPMNGDITLEHLIPLVSGGKNALSNMVLVHEKCNKDLGVLPLHQKINLIVEKRKLCK